MLSVDGLVGGNPTINTPRLRRGGGIASSSSLVLLDNVLVLLYIVQYILFATQLPSWSDGLYFLFGVFLPQPTSCFSEFIIFRNLLIPGTYFFASVWTFSESFFRFFLYLILGQLVTTEIRFFSLTSKKEKVPYYYWMIAVYLR